MEPQNNLILKARLSLQRALLGEVPPSLRAVVLSIKSHCLEGRFYFDGPIYEEEEEMVSCVESEVIADYDEGVEIKMHCNRLDFPSPIDDDGVWVFKRKENF
jgi:hypothetical protein